MKLSTYAIPASVMLAAMLAASPASAQTISGSVTDTDGGAIGSTVEVRAWRSSPHGWVIQDATFVNNLGQYTLSVPAGTYKVDARVGIATGCPNCNRIGGTGRTYQTTDSRYWRANRWHPAATTAEIWTQEDAQEVTVTSAVSVNDLNFRLPLAGAVTGRILTGSTPRAGFLIRFERTSDFRRHHNAVSLPEQPNTVGQTLRVGRFWSRGALTGVQHRLIVHDPNSQFETFVPATAFSPTSQTLTNYGDITLTAMNANPYASNNDVASAYPIPRSNFGGTPLQWESSDARIAPRNNGARDVFCWDVFAEERFYVTATTGGTVAGLPSSRYHPWVNPRLRVVHASNDTQIHGSATDEYSGPGPMDAQVDTGRISNDGRYCAKVTTVGDTSFAGTGQQTAGRYVLRIHMGNRPPWVNVTHGAQTNPTSVVVEEGDPVTLGVTYGDPEDDVSTLTIDSTLVDRLGAPVAGATFNPSGGSGNWSWDVPNPSADDSPFTVTFTVDDGEFTTSRAVVLNVDGVNFPPSTPTLISPDEGETVTTLEPTLTIGNSTDPDGDDIYYEFELYYEDPVGGEPADEFYTAIMPGGGGTTSLVAGTVPEKHTIWWRARAYDDPVEPPVGYSAWTGFRTFFVHALPPFIDAYFEDDPIGTTLVVDEGDLVVLDLEYGAPNGPAPDVTCILLDGQDDPVQPEPVLDVVDGEGTWSWQVGALDAGGGPFSLSCEADDGRYQASFDLEIVVEQKNLPPSAPLLVAPVADEVVTTRYPTLVATNAVDPEGEGAFMHFQVASDASFDDIVAETPAAGLPQDEATGETGWVVDVPLDWSAEYWFRAYATDVHDLAGPYSGIRRFEIRENNPPGSSDFSGPLGAQCSGGVVHESPMVVPVVAGQDPDDDPVSVHLQVFPYGADPSDGILIELYEPANVEGDVTEMIVDVASLEDNTRYTIRVRSSDGADFSAFTVCDFWLNLRNEPPSPLVILTPEAGTELDVGTTSVTVVVQNVWDPDLVVPGTSLEIAYCASLDPSFADCPTLPREWNRVEQSSLDPADTTEFTVNGLTPRERWHIRACALDEAGLCGPMDQTHVLIGTAQQTQSTPGGCCTTARGGEPWMALFAVLALGLMAPRTRRRRT